MRQKIAGFLTLVVTGAAAIVWTVNCVVLAVYTRHDPPPEFLLPMNIICAVLFWIAFLIRLYGFVKNRGEKSQE
ncbi:hypothetical protein [Intestinimonas sp. HCP28S3_D6]|uniref:hypothetical protein n=1 Tax=Intestinimonas sp. HCP28S3_D6 TaxID=3438942 RepID=UPI003F8BDB9A